MEPDVVQLYEELKSLNIELLFNMVARRLSGRRVQVEFRKPALQGTRGFAFRDEHQAIIHVSLDLEPAERLKVFLHEVAHVKLHYDILSSNSMFAGEPGSVRWKAKPEHDERWNAKAKETDVERLAGEWLDYVEEHAAGEGMKFKLKTLLEMSLNVR